MSKSKKDNQTKKFVKTKVRHDSSIEVDFQKNPTDTAIGKVLLYLIVAGTVLVPIAALIFALIQAGK